MAKINEVIAYRDKGHFVLALILEVKGDKFVVLTEDNKRSNVLVSKIELELNQSLTLSTKEFEIARDIKSIRNRVEQEAEAINIQQLYELVQSENEGFTFQALAEYYFAEPSLERQLAMGIALSNNSIYFKLKNDLYYPKSQKQVNEQLEEIERQQKLGEKKREEKEGAFQWLKKFLTDQIKEENLPPPLPVIKLLDPIKQYVIFKDLCEKKKTALDIIDELKRIAELKIVENPLEAMFKLLVRLKIFKENENLAILKYHIPTEFEEETIQQANEISEFTKDQFGNRKDLSSLFTLTIDDAETKDVDDAITLEKNENGYQVGVHIADVSHFILPDSKLDQEALARGLTVYLPLGKISMFPETLSEKKMSLIQDSLRPALSFLIQFDKEFRLKESEIVFSVINVNRKLTYEEADQLINLKDEVGDFLKTLYEIALKLRDTRKHEGAIDFKNPDTKIRLNEDGAIYLKPSVLNLKSDLIIKELMILSNHLAANYCFFNQIPAIYITQDPPDEAIYIDDKVSQNRALMFEQLKKMKKSNIDVQPRRHFGLGLHSYTQATSPIRRYHDLILQRQLKHFLTENKPYYSKEKIQVVAATAEKASKEVKSIERETTRFWLLKYLKQEKTRIFEALVIRKLANGYLVEVQEVFTQAILITPAYLELNQIISVSIERVNPLLDTLSIRRADKP